ncbi:MAG: response regulator [Spirochaetes bacterium]|nr:response regulator [Spirochaetota bacterium]
MVNILIVDDYEENRYLLRTYLESDGYCVFEARNGVEALQILKGKVINLIISDVLMPQMDGFTLCKVVKEDEKLKNIPFVFYTATYTDEEDINLGLNSGASRYILKPKEKEEFNKLIKEVLDEYGKGALKVEHQKVENELNYYKLYNDVLVKKLESKMLQLEDANKKLKEEILAKEKAQNEAYENFLYLNNMIDIMPNPIVILNDNYLIKKANLIFKELFNSKEDIENKNFFEIKNRIFEKTDLKDILSDILINNYEINNYEIFIEDSNNNRRFFNVRIKLIVLKDNFTKEFIIVFEDQTELKNLIYQREIMYKEILHSQRIDSIGKFAGGIAHDFNNILTIIINCSQNLIDSLDRNNPLFEEAKNIYDASINGSKLVKKILDFSKKKHSSPEVIDVHKEFDEANKLLKKLVGENIDIIYKLCAEKTKIYIDLINFEQILINLCSNAKDAMENGGIIKIETNNIKFRENNEKSILPGEYLEIKFSDNGSGIEEEFLPMIFDPFFTRKKDKEGTGLGLFLVSNIIKESNGYIFVSSEINKGTEFIILFPIIEEKPLDSTLKIEENKDNKFLKLNRVILVEDDYYVSLTIERMLRKFNVLIKKAKNAKEVFRIIEEENFIPDLIIVDFLLEDMSADILIKLLRKRFKNIKELIISGFSFEDLLRKNIEIREMNFLQKPFNIEQLRNKINELFS